MASCQERCFFVEATDKGVRDLIYCKGTHPLEYSNRYRGQGQSPSKVVRAVHGVDDKPVPRGLIPEYRPVDTFFREHNAARAERFQFLVNQIIGDQIESLADISLWVPVTRSTCCQLRLMSGDNGERFSHSLMHDREHSRHAHS